MEAVKVEKKSVIIIRLKVFDHYDHFKHKIKSMILTEFLNMSTSLSSTPPSPSSSLFIIFIVVPEESWVL